MDASDCDESDVCSEYRCGMQMFDNDQCVPFGQEDTNDATDEEEWIQCDPGSLDDILDIDGVLPTVDTPISAYVSSYAYENNEDDMDYDSPFECNTDSGCDANLTPKNEMSEHSEYSNSSSMTHSKCRLTLRWKNDDEKYRPGFEPPACTKPFENEWNQVDEKTAEVTKLPTGTASVGTQTELVKKRRVIWKRTRYVEDQKEVEIVETDETEYYDI